MSHFKNAICARKIIIFKIKTSTGFSLNREVVINLL